MGAPYKSRVSENHAEPFVFGETPGKHSTVLSVDQGVEAKTSRRIKLSEALQRR